MVFSSILFLWIFLPIVLIGNRIMGGIPGKMEQRRTAQNRFLLLASLVFYGWGGIYYLLLMLAVILINYVAGLSMEREESRKRLSLILAIVLNLGLLGYFKYFNLLISTIETVGGMKQGGLGFKEVILPIGISFYIFQAMSYTIDVYRGKTKVQRNLLDFALYVSLFPQLVAGPIVQYKDVEEQIYHRVESTELFSSGIKRFCYGLGKKVLIANTLGEVVDEIWKLEVAKIGPGVALLAAVAYTLQIYYDFSGYSDMAIGIGRMLGFQFKENFRYPYQSSSVSEFWRRWHISLSSWFKEYVYIPLGGSRVGQWKTCRNLFIVFLLTGIWHGANYTFFAWGLYYGVLVVLERVLSPRIPAGKGKFVLGRIYTILAVSFGWIFFRAPSISEACSFVGGFARFGATDYTVLTYLSMKVLLALLFGILLCGPLQSLLGDTSFGKVCREPQNEMTKADKQEFRLVVRIADDFVQMALLIASIIMVMSGTYNPFIYFQF